MSTTPSGHYIETTVAKEAVRAFVPDPLPPTLSTEHQESLRDPIRQAETALERLKSAGEMIPSVNWFIYSFVRKEALLSSEIEGTQATLTDVLSFEQTGQSGSSDIADVEEVTNYVRAANYAFDELDSRKGLPISVRLLNECHLRLMQGVRGKDKLPGEFRRSQVWVGGTRPGNAVFVPPPWKKVPDLLSAMETYIHGDDELHPLLRIAALHLQFETIHPYLDGNGRVGRLIIALLLKEWNILDNPLLYLSLYLKENQKDYYAHLNKVRESSEWIEWFKFFLTGITAVAENATTTARKLNKQISDDRHALLASKSVTVSSIQLFEALPEHPVVSMPLVTKLLGITKPTASKAINQLAANGILQEMGERKRDRLYKYNSYLALLA
ncbi:MAG: Fic family protein [Woeseiaceae bacterium]|nr:Fic family protein [Woeseiaceae bacterium]